MSGTPIQIVVVDDHAMVRKGLRMALEAHADLRVVGEAGNLQDAVEVVARTKPDVVTLDLSMPGPSGAASIARLKAACGGARIVVVTMHDDPAHVRAALAMGAQGFVNKSAADTELVAAVRAVSRGRIFVDVGDAATLESILSPGTRGDSPAVDQLSEREREVLRQVANGYTNQQIADDMGLSVKTVESYRARLMRKLGLRERADLVRVAREMGLS